MTNPDKAFFVTAYFEQVNLRIANLATLRSQKLGEVSFNDEAFILCLVYVDSLASCYYGEVSARSFCRAMRELSGNPLFAKLHEQALLDPRHDRYWKKVPAAKQQVESLVKSRPGELLDESEIAQIIRLSSSSQAEQEELVGNLWRGSIGAICYEYMRCAAVHRFAANTLAFSQTTHDGVRGFSLDFPLLYAALRNIGTHVVEQSIEKGEWFGIPDYLKS